MNPWNKIYNTPVKAKAIVSILFFVFCFYSSTAQTLQSVTDLGNTTTNSIEIGGQSVNANTTKLFINNPTAGKKFALSVGANNWIENGFHIYNWTDNPSYPLMSLSDEGKLGIGTIYPQFNFQVQKTSVAPALMIGGSYTGSPRLQLYGLDVDSLAWMGLGTDMAGNHYEHSIYFSTGNNFSPGRLTIGSFDGNQYSTKLTVLNNGNVGVGTVNPTERLSVNGMIRAKEVKVEAVNWPDYVFEDDYRVLSLESLENYIKTNKHLPEMPNAQSIEKDGLKVSEILKLQQKKIEELTLYLIEKEKQLNKQQLFIEAQQEKIIAIEKTLKNLKAKETFKN